jgi:hypothetical protein
VSFILGYFYFWATKIQKKEPKYKKNSNNFRSSAILLPSTTFLPPPDKFFIYRLSQVIGGRMVEKSEQSKFELTF